MQKEARTDRQTDRQTSEATLMDEECWKEKAYSTYSKYSTVGPTVRTLVLVFDSTRLDSMHAQPPNYRWMNGWMDGWMDGLLTTALLHAETERVVYCTVTTIVQ
jgi:hypothetical protein